MRKILGTITFPLLVLGLWLNLTIQAQALPDPYFSTISSTALMAHPKDSNYEEHAIYFPTTRERAEKRNPQKLKFRFWPNKNPKAPLVVLLAGLGGSHSTSYSNYYGYRLQKSGYQVLSLPSAFHWQFALTASGSGYPGNSFEDARDLNLLIELSLNQLPEAQPAKLFLMGFSMGAFQGAYLATLDFQKWEKVILVNPPVRLDNATATIQSMASIPIEPARKKEIKQLAVLYASKALTIDKGVTPDSFARIEQELPLSLEERKFLIGDSLRSFLGPLFFATQENKDLGILKSPFTEFFKGPRMEEAKQISFLKYFQWAQKVHPKEQLEKSISLFSSGAQEHKNIYVLHNSDDFLLSTEDSSLLKAQFGDRFIQFPWGGHMGNLWTEEHFQKILGLMQ